MPSSLRRVCAVALLAGLLSPLAASAVSAGLVVSTPSADWLQPAGSSTSPPPRSGAAMVYDAATGDAVLFGGQTSTGFLDDTWIWNGASWTQATPATPPPARADASMAYDAATGDVVLFGGEGEAGKLNDTWVWSGTAWSPLSPALSPSGRFAASMVYDPATSDVVLFGGFTASGNNAETWTWNGTTWTQATPPVSPNARGYASMAYDAATKDVVLFGGLAGLNFDDTWTWNGTTWTRATPASSPTARTNAALSFDPDLSRLVLFGGQDSTGVTSDTWTWTGSNWVLLATAHGPSTRSDAAMAYDVATGTILLEGGYGPSAPISDTWTLVATPGAPRLVKLTKTPTTITVVWEAPTSTGGSPILGYEVYVGLESRHEVTVINAKPITGTHYRFSAPSGHRLYFEVRAVNAIGMGTASNQRSAILTGPPPTKYHWRAASAAIVREVTHVPLAVFNAVGAGSPSQISAPVALKNQPLFTERVAGLTLPEVLYVGAEYCPFCAAQRWATVVALSRFGRFSSLGLTSSAAVDVYPSTASLTLSRMRYTSRYVAFSAVELTTNVYDAKTGTFGALEKLTPSQSAEFKKYDTSTYVTNMPASNDGSIPFLSFANQFLASGSSYSPAILRGLSAARIASALADPSSVLARNIIATANEQTAAICQVTQERPASVCESAGVVAAKRAIGH